MKKLVVFSGAGVSAESGIQTFRDSDGLWEQHNIEDVATPEAFAKNPALVLDFYNQRRSRIGEVQPNEGHKSLALLDSAFETTVITQNIDDLHERAGSKNILHLHGEITKARCSKNSNDIQSIGYKNIEIGQLSKSGHQLRPHIVWFGEAVPAYEDALPIISNCDILIVVGTSLNVYPAAGLIHYATKAEQKIIVDPNMNSNEIPDGFELKKGSAASVLPNLVQQLLKAN